DTGSGFNDISGANSTTLNFTANTGQNGNRYRAVFSNSCGSDTSGSATLTVNGPPVVSNDPSSQTVCAGDSVSLSASANGTPSPTVQWQVDTGSGFNDISGANSTTLNFTANTGQNGNRYRAVFSNSCGSDT